MSKALVTGGSGYFGCLLRDRLLAAGRRVRVFDLVDSDDRPADVELVQGDVRDERAIRAACEGVDAIFHNVAQVPLARDRALFDSVNRQGTENLLRAAADARVRKIVHTSSSAVFGVPPRNPVDERVAPRPGEAYGRAKLEAERCVERWVRDAGLDVTVIRPRTILGHGRLGIFQILFDWVSEGRRVPVLAGGHNVYQFVHADDLADASIRAAARPGPALYHVGAARFGTMREALEALCRHAGTGSRLLSVPMWLAEPAIRASGALGLSPLAPYHALMYGRSLWFDVSAARRDLGWEPRWSNDEMLCQSYDWYLAHREEVRSADAGSPHRSAVRQGVLGWMKRIP